MFSTFLDGLLIFLALGFFPQIVEGVVFRTSLDSTWPTTTLSVGATRQSLGDGWDYATVTAATNATTPPLIESYRSLNWSLTCTSTTDYAFVRTDGSRCAKVWTQYGILTNHPSPNYDVVFRYTFGGVDRSPVVLRLHYTFDYAPFCDLTDGVNVSWWWLPSSSAALQPLGAVSVACGQDTLYQTLPTAPVGGQLFVVTGKRGNDLYDTNYVDVAIEAPPNDWDQRCPANSSDRVPVAIVFASWWTKDVTTIAQSKVTNGVFSSGLTTEIYGNPGGSSPWKKLMVVLNNGSVYSFVQSTNGTQAVLDLTGATTCASWTTGTRREIVYGQYGPLEVTATLQSLAVGRDAPNTTATNAVFSDPLPFTETSLIIVFRDGGTYSYGEGSTVTIALVANTSANTSAPSKNDKDDMHQLGVGVAIAVLIVFILIVAVMVTGWIVGGVVWLCMWCCCIRGTGGPVALPTAPYPPASGEPIAMDPGMGDAPPNSSSGGGAAVGVAIDFFDDPHFSVSDYAQPPPPGYAEVEMRPLPPYGYHTSPPEGTANDIELIVQPDECCQAASPFVPVTVVRTPTTREREM